MSDQTILNLLVVDSSLSDIEAIARTLRNAGYVLEQPLQADKDNQVTDFIKFKPLDLIIVRLTAGLPELGSVHQRLAAEEKDIPLLVALDEPGQVNPVDLLRAGADNLFLLNQPEHLVLVVNKELAQLRIRQQVRSYEIRLKETESRSRALMDSAQDAIAYIHEGAHIYANPAYLELFGYQSEEELEGITLINMVIRSDQNGLKGYLRDTMKGKRLEPIALTGLTNAGDEMPITIRCIPTHINEEPCLQIVINTSAGQVDPRLEQDFEQRKRELEAEFAEAQSRDLLTGLYHRTHFINYLNDLRKKHPKAGGSLLYMLLNDYRKINQDQGLEPLDQLLRDLGPLITKLSSSVKGCVTARFSDAVFVLYYPADDAEDFAKHLARQVSEHSSHAAGQLVSSHVSVGICPIRPDHNNALQIIDHADRACEDARQRGPNQVAIYTPRVSAKNPEEESTAELVRDALRQRRLSLCYQAIANFQDGSEERYKVYLQLKDGTGQKVSLGTIVPAAEKFGLMAKLDRWTIESSLETLTTRYQEAGKAPSLFIRVSDNSVTDKEFCGWLAKQIKDTGLSPELVVVEVAEDLAERRFKEVKAQRQALKKLGCGFALSHFGGKSHSERILKAMRPDYAKLDISLIEKLAKAKDDASREAMSTITELTRELEVRVIAADMTSPNQMTNIWQFGVTLMQGDMVHPQSNEMDFDFAEFSG